MGNKYNVLWYCFAISHINTKGMSYNEQFTVSSQHYYSHGTTGMGTKTEIQKRFSCGEC